MHWWLDWLHITIIRRWLAFWYNIYIIIHMTLSHYSLLLCMCVLPNEYVRYILCIIKCYYRFHQQSFFFLEQGMHSNLLKWTRHRSRLRIFFCYPLRQSLWRLQMYFQHKPNGLKGFWINQNGQNGWRTMEKKKTCIDLLSTKQMKYENVFFFCNKNSQVLFYVILWFDFMFF